MDGSCNVCLLLHKFTWECVIIFVYVCIYVCTCVCIYIYIHIYMGFTSAMVPEMYTISKIHLNMTYEGLLHTYKIHSNMTIKYI